MPTSQYVEIRAKRAGDLEPTDVIRLRPDQVDQAVVNGKATNTVPRDTSAAAVRALCSRWRYIFSVYADEHELAAEMTVDGEEARLAGRAFGYAAFPQVLLRVHMVEHSDGGTTADALIMLDGNEPVEVQHAYQLPVRAGQVCTCCAGSGCECNGENLIPCGAL